MNQPIGYWARRADQLFTERMDAAIAGHGITRTHWQVLNSVAEGEPVTRAALAAGLAPFGDPARIDAVRADLTALGWLTDADPLSLTPAGRTARERVFADVSQLRARAMAGITRQEYGQTVDVLRRFVDNLAVG